MQSISKDSCTKKHEPPFQDFFLTAKWGEILGEVALEGNWSVEHLKARAHPDDFPAIEKGIGVLLAGYKERGVVEFRFRARDRWIWIQSHGIVAEREEHAEQALRELDRAPMQVLIEASIVEVSLTGNLAYGVEWYLQNGLSRGRQGEALLDSNNSSGIGAKLPGFSYTISKADVVRATLNAVSTKSQVRLLSSPSILVLNNHTANIQVGQQQPILSSTAAATGSNFITQSITYKDTGVLLSVTPSVNAGGLISMDISQQVTDVGERDVVTSQRSFQTRQIQTRVAVRSGESIVLGGLIRENDSNTRSGLPGLADVPLLGALFSNTSNQRNRTELLVLMTPRALEDDDQLRSASAEMRERMRSLSLQAQPMSFRPPDAQLQPSR